MTKYLILIVIADVSTTTIGVYHVLEIYLSLPMLTAVIVSIDCFINVTCVYLQFSFGDDAYKNTCKLCDRKVKRKVTDLAVSIDEPMHLVSVDMQSTSPRSVIPVTITTSDMTPVWFVFMFAWGVMLIIIIIIIYSCIANC